MSWALAVLVSLGLAACGGSPTRQETRPASDDLGDLAGELDAREEIESRPGELASGPRFSPLVWRWKNKEGKSNYLLAEHSFVTASELPAELWELAGKATLIASPFDLARERYIEAFDQLPNRLRSQLSPRDLIRLLIQLPSTRRKYLTKFSPVVLAGFLHRPARPPGLGIGDWVHQVAKRNRIPVRYYGGDLLSFMESYLALGDRPEVLLAALDDARPGKRLAASARDAYLRGDESGLNVHEDRDPRFRRGHKALIAPWLATIIDILESNESALVVVPSHELFTEGGIIEGLRAAGFELERALPDAPPSVSQWVPDYVPLDKCHDLLLHFVAITNPEASLVLHNATDQDEVFSSEEVRPIMGGCLRRTMGYYKCGLESRDLQDIRACERSFPMHIEDFTEE